MGRGKGESFESPVFAYLNMSILIRWTMAHVLKPDLTYHKSSFVKCEKVTNIIRLL
jgi:hypothetical protein